MAKLVSSGSTRCLMMSRRETTEGSRDGSEEKKGNGDVQVYDEKGV